jgi:hypothetical protein
MAIDRRPAIVMVIALTVVAFTGILLTLGWMSPLTVGPMSIVELEISEVQFDNDYLNVTVKNIGTSATTINQVIVNQTSAPYTVPVHEPVVAGGQISIRARLNWVSGSTYHVGLRTGRGEVFYRTAVAP